MRSGGRSISSRIRDMRTRVFAASTPADASPMGTILLVRALTHESARAGRRHPVPRVPHLTISYGLVLLVPSIFPSRHGAATRGSERLRAAGGADGQPRRRASAGRLFILSMASVSCLRVDKKMTCSQGKQLTPTAAFAGR